MDTPDGNAKQGFSGDYFANIAELEEDSFWFQSRNALIEWAVGRYCSASSNFLDIGCGNGFVLQAVRRRFPALRVIGADPWPEALQFARRRVDGALLLQTDVRRLPFCGVLDLIGAFDVIEHVPDDVRALGEFHAALRPGGGLIVTVPQHMFLWSAIDEFSRHYRRYGRAELIAKVTAAGFDVVRVTSFVSLLMPLLVISRMWESARAGQFDRNREHAIDARINRALGWVMAVERILIKAGLSLPFGGSLMVVAVKSKGMPDGPREK